MYKSNFFPQQASDGITMWLRAEQLKDLFEDSMAVSSVLGHTIQYSPPFLSLLGLESFIDCMLIPPLFNFT